MICDRKLQALLPFSFWTSNTQPPLFTIRLVGTRFIHLDGIRFRLSQKCSFLNFIFHQPPTRNSNALQIRYPWSVNVVSMVDHSENHPNSNRNRDLMIEQPNDWLITGPDYLVRPCPSLRELCHTNCPRFQSKRSGSSAVRVWRCLQWSVSVGRP